MGNLMLNGAHDNKIWETTIWRILVSKEVDYTKVIEIGNPVITGQVLKPLVGFIYQSKEKQ